MLTNLLIGNEKAIIGGLTSGILTLLAQVNITGQMTTKELVTSAATWGVTHLAVWLGTNSKKLPSSIASPQPLTAPLPEGQVVPPFSKVQ